MLFKSQVIGCGSYLPPRILTNNELASAIETSHEWIVERTGIHQRHIAGDEPTSSLATQAAKKALSLAGIEATQIDLIVLATTTPDHAFPATATRVQTNLGASRAFAFDVQAVCSGFVYALSVADQFIKTGQVKTALVIGAESMSNILNWEDRGTCILFGDGAGAVVLQATQPNNPRGIQSTHLFSDGTLYDALYVDHHEDSPKKRGYIKMQGRQIFIQAVKKISQAIEAALEHNNLTVHDIDWFVPHQANLRIIQGVEEHIKLPAHKTVITIHQHANTSAASIPIALDCAVQDGRIQKGQNVLIEAMGGGLTWASSLIRW